MNEKDMIAKRYCKHCKHSRHNNEEWTFCKVIGCKFELVTMSDGIRKDACMLCKCFEKNINDKPCYACDQKTHDKWESRKKEVKTTCKDCIHYVKEDELCDDGFWTNNIRIRQKCSAFKLKKDSTCEDCIHFKDDENLCKKNICYSMIDGKCGEFEQKNCKNCGHMDNPGGGCCARNGKGDGSKCWSEKIWRSWIPISKKEEKKERFLADILCENCGMLVKEVYYDSRDNKNMCQECHVKLRKEEIKEVSCKNCIHFKRGGYTFCRKGYVTIRTLHGCLHYEEISKSCPTCKHSSGNNKTGKICRHDCRDKNKWKRYIKKEKNEKFLDGIVEVVGKLLGVKKKKEKKEEKKMVKLDPLDKIELEIKKEKNRRNALLYKINYKTHKKFIKYLLNKGLLNKKEVKRIKYVTCPYGNWHTHILGLMINWGNIENMPAKRWNKIESVIKKIQSSIDNGLVERHENIVKEKKILEKKKELIRLTGCNKKNKSKRCKKMFLKICEKCGSEVPIEGKFCNNCGVKF